jgi:hypothetical protein
LPFQKLSGDIENHISITGYKEWKELIIVYLDDIIIKSDTNLKPHLLLHTTFKLLSEAGLNIKPEK